MIKSTHKNKLILAGAVLLALSPGQAHADDETKRLIGGIAAGLVGMALENAANQDAQQNENIQWNQTGSGQQGAGYDAGVEELQILLNKQGFYNGAIDGLKGAGTVQAIKAWEQHHGLVVDGELSQEEKQVLLHMDAGNDDQVAHWKEKVGFLKEKSATHGSIAQKSVTFSDEELERGAESVVHIAKDKLLLQVCRDFKGKYLTVEFSNKGLEKAEQYVQGAVEKYSQNLSCRGYGQAEIDRLFVKADELALDSEEGEELDTLQKILAQDQDNLRAQDVLTSKCGSLTGTADQQIEFQKSYKFNSRTCEFD